MTIFLSLKLSTRVWMAFAAFAASPLVAAAQVPAGNAIEKEFVRCLGRRASQERVKTCLVQLAQPCGDLSQVFIDAEVGASYPDRCFESLTRGKRLREAMRFRRHVKVKENAEAARSLQSTSLSVISKSADSGTLLVNGVPAPNGVALLDAAWWDGTMTLAVRCNDGMLRNVEADVIENLFDAKNELQPLPIDGWCRQVTPDPAPHRIGYLWGTGALAVGGIGMGALFWLRSVQKANESNVLCGPGDGDPLHCGDARGLELDNEARTAHIVSLSSFGIGVVSTAVFTYLLVAESVESTTKTHARPMVFVTASHRGAGVEIVQSW